MRRILLLISIFVCTLPFSAVAYDLLIIKSQNSPVYDEILKGVRSTKQYSERVLSLSDYAKVDVRRIVREERPNAILTFGDLALESARKVTQTPVVPLMTSNLRQRSESQYNLSGIDTFIAPERYLNLFRQLKLPRVGVIYSKAKSGPYIQKAQRTAGRYGITLVTIEVSSPKEAIAQLSTLKGNVDALWMLPDPAVYSQTSIEGFTAFSIEQQIPFVSYASAFLSHGALAVIEMDINDLGVQAAEILEAIMDGQTQPTISPPRKASLKINSTISRRLGISRELLEKLQQGNE